MKSSSDHLGDIRLFVAVADVGSLTVAASGFGFSVAAASVRLSKLERYLGVKLFNRSTKRLMLTEEGQDYLKECVAALHIIDGAELRLKSGQKSADGSIKISAATDFGKKYVSGWIDDFLKTYSDIRVSLFLEDDFSDILRNDVDVAIRFAKPVESALVVKRLAANYRVLCASPAYLEEYGYPQTPEDLAEHKFIVLATQTKVLNEYYFERDGLETSYTTLPSQSWVVNDGEMATKWAMAGRGITRKTIWDAVRYLRSGELSVVLGSYISQEDGVFIVRRDNKYLPRRVRLFLDFLEEKFNAEQKNMSDYLNVFTNELEQVFPESVVERLLPLEQAATKKRQG
ncbi:MAG: LysR family transcriptional regulator [Ottowia sp.]|uniref:LysR family transcriptional regulator n=1 Tax=unclassified Ottowia TaxID=2645081 RepID=UPI003C30D4F3